MVQTEPDIGVGFRHEHFSEIMRLQPELGFFEVHAENYMGDGGAPHKILSALRARHDLSVHGVGMSIGGRSDLDLEHLARLKSVVERYKPRLVSEHLAWSSHNEAANLKFLNDLLPLPYTETTLARTVDHVNQLQDTLGRQILMENPSTYVAFSDSRMSETEFITRMQQQTGCGLLLDVNNVYISANNQKTDARRYLCDFPLHAVGEIHLAGHAEDSDEYGEPLLIDTHDRAVAPNIWSLFEYVLNKTGPVATLVEWDNDVPDWQTLCNEANKARDIMLGPRATADAAE